MPPSFLYLVTAPHLPQDAEVRLRMRLSGFSRVTIDKIVRGERGVNAVADHEPFFHMLCGPRPGSDYYVLELKADMQSEEGRMGAESALRQIVQETSHPEVQAYRFDAQEQLTPTI